MKAVLIVLDSVGIGSAPDADAYGDQGSATLPHLASVAGPLHVPYLQKLGLGNIPTCLNEGESIKGVPEEPNPLASFGMMQEMSEGKDTITGHWEIGGILIHPGFHLFPHNAPSFPEELLDQFIKETGRDILGNKAASGTAIIEELGKEHMETGHWIVYTSADSVMQIAAHTEIIPLEEQYRACEIARRLCDPYKVGRVIARPFKGSPGNFERTEDRRDYAYQPEEPFIHERIQEAGYEVCSVGKIEDIFAHRGFTRTNHTGNTLDSAREVSRLMEEDFDGLIFANYIDFDMLYGHRRDPDGYARALEATDPTIGELMNKMTDHDMLIITADHGNDPTYEGTDHTRELVPLLIYQPGIPGRNLGIRKGFYDIAQTLAAYFKLSPMPRGTSCI